MSEKNDLLAALREEKVEVTNLKTELVKLREDYSRVLAAEVLIYRFFTFSFYSNQTGMKIMQC